MLFRAALHTRLVVLELPCQLVTNLGGHEPLARGLAPLGLPLLRAVERVCLGGQPGILAGVALHRALAAVEQLPDIDAVVGRVLPEIVLDCVTIHAVTSLFTGCPEVRLWVPAVASRGVDRVKRSRRFREPSGPRRALARQRLS